MLGRIPQRKIVNIGKDQLIECGWARFLTFLYFWVWNFMLKVNRPFAPLSRSQHHLVSVIKFNYSLMFDSLMNWSYVFCNISLFRKFFATLSAMVFDSLMNCSDMFLYTAIGRKLFATLSAWMFDSLMNWSYVFCENSLCWKFFATLYTRMFDSFMNHLR